MPSYRRYYVPGHPVFLTIVTHRRQPWLADDASVQTLLQAMRWARDKHPFRHVAHVILPDHLHWMLVPAEDTCFSDLVGAIKRETTWCLKETGNTGPFWQKRFYDHVIRNDDDFQRHLDYIHFNPVKHGVATRAADHQWSSFHEWVKRGVYPQDWGAIEPIEIKDWDLE